MSMVSIMKTFVPALTMALLAPTAQAQLGPGAPAPEIEVKSWLNAPAEGTNLEDLRGRVVFLEFWATW